MLLLNRYTTQVWLMLADTQYFLYPVIHYHMLNATALAGAVNAALAWWYQLWTRLYLDLKIWPSVVTQLPGFTKAVAMAAALMNG